MPKPLRQDVHCVLFLGRKEPAPIRVRRSLPTRLAFAFTRKSRSSALRSLRALLWKPPPPLTSKLSAEASAKAEDALGLPHPSLTFPHPKPYIHITKASVWSTSRAPSSPPPQINGGSLQFTLARDDNSTHLSCISAPDALPAASDTPKTGDHVTLMGSHPTDLILGTSPAFVFTFIER